MYEKVRSDPEMTRGPVELRSDLDFCIDAEAILERVRDVAEGLRTQTEAVLGDSPGWDAREFDCPI